MPRLINEGIDMIICLSNFLWHSLAMWRICIAPGKFINKGYSILVRSLKEESCLPITSTIKLNSSGIPTVIKSSQIQNRYFFCKLAYLSCGIIFCCCHVLSPILLKISSTSGLSFFLGLKFFILSNICSKSSSFGSFLPDFLLILLRTFETIFHISDTLLFLESNCRSVFKRPSSIKS